MPSPSPAEANLIQASPSDIRQEIGTLREAGHLAAADELLEVWLGRRFGENDHTQLQTLLACLPPAWINSRAQALWWMSRYYAPSSEGDALQAKREMESAYEAGERNPVLVRFLAASLTMDGLYDLALPMVRQALATELSDLDRMRFLHTYADLQDFLGDYTGVEESATALLELATRNGRMRFVGIANGLLAYAHGGLGNDKEVDRFYMRAINMFRQTKEWPQLNVHLSNYAEVLMDRGRPGEAEALLIEARGLPGQSPRLLAVLALTTSMVHHLYGRHAAALVSTAEAATLLRETGMQGQETFALQMCAERLALDGQMNAANEALRRAQALIGQDNKYQTSQDFTSGILAWIRGDFTEAEQDFQRTLLSFDLLSKRERARLQFYLLALKLRNAPEQQMLDTLALDESLREAGSDSALITDAPVLTDTLRWLAGQPGWQERLDAVFRNPPEGTVQLRIEPFGPLEILAEGRLLHFGLKRSAELLAFLALHGSATRQEVLTALFDGDTSTKTVDNFKKTVKGLRDALKPLLPQAVDPVVSQGRRYSLHHLLEVSVSWLPDRVFAAPAVRRAGPIEVRGPFLADVKGEWALDARDRVHAALRTHLQQLVESGDISAARALSVVNGLE